MSGKYGSADVALTLEDAPGGTAMEIHGFVLDMGGVQITARTTDSTQFGDPWDKHVMTGRRAVEQITITGFWDTTSTTGSHAIFRGMGSTVGIPTDARELVLTMGDWRFTVDVLILSYQASSEVRKFTRFEVVLLPTGAGIWAHDLLAKAINYWKMEETGTADRVDTSGSDDLTPNVSMGNIAGGKNNNACEFTSNATSLVSTSWRAVGWTGMTFSAWLKRTAIPTGSAYLLSENTTSSIAFSLFVQATTGDLRGTWRAQDLSFGGFDTDLDPETDQRWVHVAVSWNSGEFVEIYVDGVLRDTSASTLTGTLRDNDVGIVLGALSNGTAGYGATGGPAWMDEVAIWDFGIGLSGAGEMYNGGAGVFL